MSALAAALMLACGSLAPAQTLNLDQTAAPAPGEGMNSLALIESLQKEIAELSKPGVPGSFVGTFSTREPGDYAAEPLDTALLGLGISTPFEVITSDDELKNPAADHAALARLSEQTGGELIPASQLAELPAKLPNRQLRLLGAEEIWTLWDRPLALALIVILLTLEWAGRKWIRLV